MISRIALDSNQLLALFSQEVNRHCRNHKLPYAPVTYSKTRLRSSAEFDPKTGNILVNPVYSSRLSRYPTTTRVWAVFEAIGHELAHYGQYLQNKRLDEDEADMAGKHFADETMSRLTKNEINPTKSLYSSFHGANPARTRQVIIETPKRLIKIGRLISLVYKPESPSKRKGTYYEHKFSDYGDRFGGPKPILAVSEDGKQIFVVNDESDYKFNERGIVG